MILERLRQTFGPSGAVAQADNRIRKIGQIFIPKAVVKIFENVFFKLPLSPLANMLTQCIRNREDILIASAAHVHDD